jgi:hypothetical protein
MISETVNQLQSPTYDINVWSREGYVYLTFYPLRYPGDKYYPDADLEHGLPVVDTSTFYSLKIDRRSRGPLRRDALEYLRNLVNEDHFDNPERYPAELWDDEDGMDWWSCETVLTKAPELIRDFVSTLPGRSN